VSGPPVKLVPQSDNFLKGEEAVRFLIGSCIVFALTGVLCAQTRDDLLSAKVDEAVTHLRQKQKIPGTNLAVVRDGKIIKVASYGLASVELNVPVKPETIFPAASLTKQFTATAVMLLVEEGKVGLDDSITKYFPEAPATWKPITIRHLLSHGSVPISVEKCKGVFS
jgi:CubicO group peptidase (beta-lactamase class C family)